MSETPCASLFSVLGVLDDDISAVQQWVVSVPLPFLHCNGQCIAYRTAECTAHCALLKVGSGLVSHHPPSPPVPERWDSQRGEKKLCLSCVLGYSKHIICS